MKDDLSGLYLVLAGIAVVLLHFRGRAIGSGMFMPGGVVALLARAVIAVGVVSAVAGLRRLNVSPWVYGRAQQHPARGGSGR